MVCNLQSDTVSVSSDEWCWCCMCCWCCKCCRWCSSVASSGKGPRNAISSLRNPPICSITSHNITKCHDFPSPLERGSHTKWNYTAITQTIVRVLASSVQLLVSFNCLPRLHHDTAPTHQAISYLSEARDDAQRTPTTANSQAISLV